jgi:hypothetical protein
MLRADEPDERGITGTSRHVPYGYEKTNETADPEAGLAPDEWPVVREDTLYRVEALRDKVVMPSHRAVYVVPATETYLWLVGGLQSEGSTIESIDAVDEQTAVAELSTFEAHGADSYLGVVEWLSEQGRHGKPYAPA